jgi:hypothetical protein
LILATLSGEGEKRDKPAERVALIEVVLRKDRLRRKDGLPAPPSADSSSSASPVGLSGEVDRRFMLAEKEALIMDARR